MRDFSFTDQLADADRKRLLNRQLFDAIAGEYDRITRILSLGRDQAWKRQLNAACPDLGPESIILDLACGTGDLTRSLADRYPRGRVTGLDISVEMLSAARMRSAGVAAISFREADMADLPFPEGSVDLVTGGYALRNAPELTKAIEEIHRVLRPGGSAAFLDFSNHPWKPRALTTRTILRLWGSLWGLCFHGNAAVYGYIAESLAHYPDRSRLHRQFREGGLEVTLSRLFYGGMLELLVVRRPE